MTESEVVGRAKRGDEQALRVLYEDHVERIYRLAFRMTADEDLARDLTQDAFVRAFERLEAFREESTFSTWLHAIAIRLVLNGRRRRSWWRERARSLASLDGVADPGADPDRWGERREVQARVREAVAELPEIYRLVVVMHELEDYTHEEIGDALGVAAGTSKARLSRARSQLRARLQDLVEDHGVREEDSLEREGTG